MNTLRLEKKLAIVSALVEGNSIRSIERMTKVHRDTIMRLLCFVGDKCQELLNKKMKNINAKKIQVDEIWTFVKKKQKRVNGGDGREVGDQYVFVALEADTKLIPSYTVGKRDFETAFSFLRDLQQRLNSRIQLTSDGFRAYKDTVDMTFGTDVDFAQLVKIYYPSEAKRERYSPGEIIEIVSKSVMGNPDPKQISTSYVERQNLTMRMQMRRFTRLTNGFSKKLKNLKATLALHFAYYNFVRVHSSLRVTPAMEAGITDHVWSLRELLEENGYKD